MTIEYKKGSDGYGHQGEVRMTSCPFCGQELQHNKGFAEHHHECTEV